jgi:hypothetical protein
LLLICHQRRSMRRSHKGVFGMPYCAR